MHITGTTRRGASSIWLHPTGPGEHSGLDATEPWRYLPHTPGCCSSKQRVIVVIWGRTESGEGEGARAAPTFLQATLRSLQDLSLEVPGSLFSPQKLPGSGASGCSAGKSFGKTKVPSYWGFTCRGKRWD